jgi:hypothetical protein
MLFLNLLLAAVQLEAPPSVPPRLWMIEDNRVVFAPDSRIAGMPHTGRFSGSFRSQITCVIVGDGRLDDCGVNFERPQNVGIGAAAIRSVRNLRLVIAEGGPQVGDQLTLTVSGEAD